MKQRACRILAILAIAAAPLVTGCAGTVKNMRELPAASAAPTPQPEKAMVVFMRPSGVGFAIQSSVFEVRDARPSLAGILAAKTKVAYHVDPGQHTFMVIGENADFMTADLLPNRTYYAYVSPRIGMWKARFAFEPKHGPDLATAGFKGDLQECRWVEVTAESEQWMRDNLESIQSKRAEYFPDWQKTPAAERPGLLPDDGR